jgi:hypothetical protein
MRIRYSKKCLPFEGFFSRYFSIVILLFYVNVALYSQGLDVSGRIQDPWGHGIVDATVTASTSEWQQTTYTNADGAYFFTDLAVTVQKQGDAVTLPATLQCYPNPTTGRTRMHLPPNTQLKIVNILGQEVGSYESTVGAMVHIDMRGLARGLYLAKLISMDDDPACANYDAAPIVHLGSSYGASSRVIIKAFETGRFGRGLNKTAPGKFDVDFAAEKDGYFSNQVTLQIKENLQNSDLIIVPHPAAQANLGPGDKEIPYITMSGDTLGFDIFVSGYANNEIGKADIKAVIENIQSGEKIVDYSGRISLNSLDIPEQSALSFTLPVDSLLTTFQPGEYFARYEISQILIETGEEYAKADTLPTLVLWGSPQNGIQVGEGMIVNLEEALQNNYVGGKISLVDSPFPAEGNSIAIPNDGQGIYNVKIQVEKDGRVIEQDIGLNVGKMSNIPIRTYEMKDLKGIIDGTAQGTSATVIIGHDTVKTDSLGRGYINTSPQSQVEILVEKRKDGSPDSFESLFWIPADKDLENILNIPFTGYEGTTYGLPDSIAVTPEVYRAFNIEGNFGMQGGADYEGFKGFDWSQPQKFWIDAGQLETEIPDVYKTYTPEQQEEVARLISELLFDSFIDSSYFPEIIIASPEDSLPFVLNEQGFIRPDSTYRWIVPKRTAPQMAFGAEDYNQDGILDAARIYNTYLNNISAQRIEYNSNFVIGAIEQDEMRGKTMFHQEEKYLGPDLRAARSPHDIKVINMQQLLHPEPDAIREINGKLFLGYAPKIPMDRIIGLPQ